MEISTLLMQQSTDIFRLGLLAGLIYTTERNRLQTGVWLPLIAGVFFIAFIIPVTMPRPDVSLWLAVSTGIAVNAVIVGVLWMAWQQIAKSGRS